MAAVPNMYFMSVVNRMALYCINQYQPHSFCSRKFQDGMHPVHKLAYQMQGQLLRALKN